jgi:hypothetical protein
LDKSPQDFSIIICESKCIDIIKTGIDKAYYKLHEVLGIEIANDILRCPYFKEETIILKENRSSLYLGKRSLRNQKINREHYRLFRKQT